MVDGKLSLPPLKILPSEENYKIYFEEKYCIKPIITFDNIPIWFKKEIFNHAFYESSKRNKIKDLFSTVRAQRISWIKETLKNPRTRLYKGWDKKKKKYRDDVRVNFVYDDYVVITAIWKKSDGSYRGLFKTAFVAENSILMIKASPEWTKK